jgi:hypothetical protein
MEDGAVWGRDPGSVARLRVIWDTDFTDEHGIKLKNQIYHRAAESTEKVETLDH